MLKKTLIVLAAFFGSVSFAQLPWPIDLEVGSKWFLTDSASLFGSARTYIPTGVEALGTEIFFVPEVGYHYQNLAPYASLELNIDGEFATLAVWGMYSEGVASLSVATRFCILSDR